MSVRRIALRLVNSNVRQTKTSKCQSKVGTRHQSNFQRHFKPAVKKAGLRGVTFHDLRRTHATALVAAGLDPKVIQERMGHSSIQTTLALYAQATQEGLKSASAVMESFLESSQTF